jgi:ribosomal protein S18 acetylase RimI-like enzyme
MSLEIKVFKCDETDRVYGVFEKAFENYQIPIIFHRESHVTKWKEEGLRWDLSFGIYQDEDLVGFILHGIQGGKLWNIATGVLENFRGGLISRVYPSLFQELSQKYSRIYLKVLITNERALKAYTKVGFRITHRGATEFEMVKII